MANTACKVRRIEGHDCNVPLHEDLITFYINGGLFVDLRRKFRKYVMVCAQNAETKTILRSTAQIGMEESRHLHKYYHMIHPFSQARVTWEMIMIIVYCSLFTVMPLDLATVETPLTLLYIKTVLDLIALMDIGLFFCTGFYDFKMHKVVLKRKRVFKKYVTTYFFFDLLSSIPYQLYVDVYQQDQESLYQMKYFYIMKLARLPTLILYIKKFSIRMNIYSYKLATVNFIIWFVFLILWATCLTVLMHETLGRLQFNDDFDIMDLMESLITSGYFVVRAFTLIQITTDQIAAALPMAFNILYVLIGCVLNIFILALVMQIFRQHLSSRNKYDDLLQQIGEYMNYRELPHNTKKRVFQYVEFKFQKNVFKEGDILSTLSTILQEDILLHNCKKMIEKVEFFKNAPASLTLRLLTKLKSEIFLPNDVIVQAGITGNAMYFIYVGTVAVYTKNGSEICHLEDGSHFGEIALIINVPRVATVIAITNCEVYRLSRKDFLEAIAPFPQLSRQIRESGLERLKTTQMMYEQENKTHAY